MHFERGAQKHLRCDPIRLVAATTNLFEHHFEFVGQLLLVEARVLNRVRQNVERDVELPARHRDVVDRLIETRPRVDVASGGLDVSGDRADRASVGPLEQHMLMDVREAGLLWALIGRADPYPHLDRRHRRRMVFFDQNFQPVRQGRAKH